MVGVRVHSLQGEPCLLSFRYLSARKQLSSFRSDENFPADENSLTLCIDENLGSARSYENVEPHHSTLDDRHCNHGTLEALGSNGKLENFHDLRNWGILRADTRPEVVYSRKESASFCRMSRIPSNEDIQTLCRQGKLELAVDGLYRMQSIPLYNTYLSLLQACTKQNSLVHVERVHAHLANHHLDQTTFLGGYVVNAVTKCGALEEALHLFQRLPHRTVHVYAPLISMLADHYRGRDALQMQVRMQEDGIEPDQHIYVGLLKACGAIPDLKEGKKLHGEAQLKGLEHNLYIGSALVSMYGRCGSIEEAENVFSKLAKDNVVLWNAMLTTYIERNEAKEALLAYRQMLDYGPERDQGTFVLALKACSILAEGIEEFVRDAQMIKSGILSIGHALHADAWRNGYASDVVIGSALVTMYANCGFLSGAESVFSRLSEHDKALWHSMLSAYVDAGKGRKCLWLYLHMQKKGVPADEQTITIALCACGAMVEKEEALVVKEQHTRLLPLAIAEALEKDVGRKGIISDTQLCNMLVFVYGKCGAVAKAEEAFFKLSSHSKVSWNCMLSVYVKQRHGETVIQAFKLLLEELVSLNDVTSLYVLQACNETGCLEICKEIHFALTSADAELDTLLATTLLQAYGGCASLKSVESIFDALCEPNMLSWDAYMTGYAQGGSCMNTLKMLEEMGFEGFNPDVVMFTHVLSACNRMGCAEEGLNYFNSMSDSCGLSPELPHYGNLIDLFGRVGDFQRVKAILDRMPMRPDLAMRSCLREASWRHGNAEFDHWALKQSIDGKGCP